MARARAVLRTQPWRRQVFIVSAADERCVPVSRGSSTCLPITNRLADNGRLFTRVASVVWRHPGNHLVIMSSSYFYLRYASAGISRRRVSVCVCLSQAGIVSKRLSVGSRKERHVIAQELWFSDANSRWWATPIPLKFALIDSPTPFQKQRFRPISLIAPQPWELAKKV